MLIDEMFQMTAEGPTSQIDTQKCPKSVRSSHKRKHVAFAIGQRLHLFFGWLLHGSTSPLSGRSPFCQLQLGENVAKTLDIYAVSRRVQGADKGGLFLGRLDQGLAESTHVDRPKGKATLVPKVGRTVISY